MSRQGAAVPLKTISLGELLALPIPQREPLLAPWLLERHLNMTYAPTGVGKSLFALSIALAIAGGGSYLGWEAPKPRRVLLVDGEMDVLDLKERARMLLPAVPGADPEATSSNLLILAQQAQAPGVQFPDLADEEGRQAILKLAAEHGAELVILDNFSTLATVEDENAASSFDPVIRLMLDLRQGGAACMLIHHARKGAPKESSYRGTSKMGVVFNSIIQLSHPGGVPSTGGAAFELQWEKYRGLRDETIRPLKVTLRASGDTPAAWSAEESEDAQLLTMIAKLKELECSTQAELAEALGVTQSTLTKRKHKAIAKGLITAEAWDQCLAFAKTQADQQAPDF